MNPDIANTVTQRIAQQIGSMMLQIIQLQAEKEAETAGREAAEQALEAAKAEHANQTPI